MPLIPIQPIDLEVVEIDGDTYHLRKHLSMTDFAHSSALIAQATVLKGGAEVLKDPRYLASVMDKLPDVSQMARDAIEKAAAVSNQLVALWLVGWSHPDELNAANIERMPQAHMKAVQEAIMKLHNANKGESDDTPVGKSSPPSSDSGSTEKPSG